MAEIKKIQFKRGTKVILEKRLVASDLGIPLKGEPIYETDSGKIKIGDGTSTYAELPYISGGGSGQVLTADGKSVIITNDIISLFGFENAANQTVARKSEDGTLEWVEVLSKTEVEALIADKQDKINDLETIRSGAALGATALQSVPDDYAKKTDIPDVSNFITKDVDNLTNYTKSSDLATVATSGSYNDLSNKPEIPTVDVNKEYVDTELAKKQDTISDLETIRSGAEAGATAVQPDTLTNYATISYVNEELVKKQDVLTAGSNITIEKNEQGQTVISSTGGGEGGSYVAGAGISISGNTISLIEKYAEYLENATYVKPTIAWFSMANTGTYEVTQSVKVSAFTHYETEIDSIKTLVFSGNGLSVDVTPKTVSTSVDIAEQTIDSNTTFTLKETDTKGNTASKTATYTFNEYAYTKVDASSTAPTTGLTKQATISSFANNGADFTYNQNDYIYFYTTKSGATVQTNVLGQWVDVEFESLGSETITLACGNTKDYYVYRVQLTAGSGTAKYRVC